MARDNEEIKELRKKFVCVRLVQMKGVDVSLFQFDWNVMITAIFMSADGMIYARYGSPDPRALSTAGFKKTMERVLEAHAKPDREALKAKRGAPLKWTTPESMPPLAERFKDSAPPKNCIHCHHVWVGLIRGIQQDGKTLPASIIWRYPKPEALGLTIDLDDGAKVTAVADGSLAAKAGVKTGDAVVRVGGQPVYSISDVEWALHNAPDRGDLAMEVKRGTESVSMTLTLGDGWRRVARRGVFGVVGLGMKLDPLPVKARAAAGIEEGKLAIAVSNVQKAGPARDAGFRNGDVVVSIEGKSAAMGEDELVALVRMNFPIGSKGKMEILREGVKSELTYEVK